MSSTYCSEISASVSERSIESRNIGLTISRDRTNIIADYSEFLTQDSSAAVIDRRASLDGGVVISSSDVNRGRGVMLAN